MKVTILLLFIVLQYFGVHGLRRGDPNVCRESYRTRKCTRDFLGQRECKRVTRRRNVCCEGWRSIDGGETCSQPRCQSRWGTCRNGGTCVDVDQCTCTDNYYSPRCNLCTRIENCQDGQYYCTTSDDQQCRRCEFTIDHEKRAYTLEEYESFPDRICTQLCSWRADSKQCYPGNCTASPPLASSCMCAPGFGNPENDCLQIHENPDIADCQIHLNHLSGDALLESFTFSCDNENNPPFFTNYKDINRIQADLKTLYTGPNIHSWPLPYYISYFAVGITDTMVHWRLKRDGDILASGDIDCAVGLSNDNPNVGLHTCNKEQELNITWDHKDVLELEVNATNGGLRKIKNFDNGVSNTTDEIQYYFGSTLVHRLNLTFDFVPPEHCSLVSNCHDNLLDIESPYTKETSTHITWSGWTDSLSSIIERYIIEVYKLAPVGNHLGYAATLPLLHQTYFENPTNIDFHFPQPGVYCFLLTVIDAATNLRHARRFALFDNETTVQTSTRYDNRIVVESAIENTTQNWQTNLNSPITISWKGHFKNEVHNALKYLGPIVDHHIPVDSGYEETVGQPPFIRSTESILNVNGTTRYQIAYTFEQNGRNSNADIPTDGFEDISSFMDESHELSVSRDDGDSIRVWIKAYDVLNNTAVDSVVVNIDSSPPAIEAHGLFKNGHHQLAVHNSKELYEMRFIAADYHSGVREVRWELNDLENRTITHGSGRLPVSRVECERCEPPYCYVTAAENQCYNSYFILEPDASKFSLETGQHNHDYVLKISATNNAMLIGYADFQISIDISAPISGVVFDAEPGQVDRDFQTSSDIHASWTGFFDKESGIKQYDLVLDSTCQTADQLVHHPNVYTQSATYHTFHNQSSGIFYVTVIAYNNAMEASDPICSDGVTVDKTPPFVGLFKVSQLSLKPGLIADQLGNVAYIDRHGYRHDMLNNTCSSDGLHVDDIDIYYLYTNVSRSDNDIDCEQPRGKYMFISDPTKLNISWTGYDNESAPLDYHICLGNNVDSSDIHPCTTTNGQTTYITHHPNLQDMEIFYINIIAINKAGLRTSKGLGPIQVRLLGPSPPISFVAWISMNSSRELINLKWVLGNTYENQFEVDFLMSISFAIGENSCEGNKMEFMKISRSIHTQEHLDCSWQDPPNCVSIATSELKRHLHHDTTYCVILKFEGTNSIPTYVTASFLYLSSKFVRGAVVEYDRMDTNSEFMDIDHQTYSDRLSIHINGFSTTDSDITLDAAISTNKSWSGVIKTIRIDFTHGALTFHELELLIHENYFTIIRTTSLSGYHNYIISDGITILPRDNYDIAIRVIDGKRCPETQSGSALSNCGVDLEFQSHSTSFDAHWIYPDHISSYVIGHYVALFQENDELPLQIHPSIDVGLSKSVSFLGLSLEHGKTYFVRVTVCNILACYMAASSNGVTILANAPVAQPILNASIDIDIGLISLQWKHFTDSFIEGIKFMARYNISVLARHDNGMFDFIGHLMSLDVEELHNINNTVSVQIPLESDFDDKTCIFIMVTGISKVGMHSSTKKKLTGCTDANMQSLQILDAHLSSDTDRGDISVDEAVAVWAEPDREFTSSVNTLSAVWPRLHHNNFAWKVLSSETIRRWAYYKEAENLAFDDFDCASPEVLACGATEKQWVKVNDLALVDGQRYFICISALGNGQLDAVSECSNGIVVDTRPPVAGNVMIGYREEHKVFQTDDQNVEIWWNGFHDAERYANTKQQSSIITFLVSLGTETGGNDVIDNIDAGKTNYFHISDLHLEEGRAYFASVTAIDAVNMTSTAYSSAFLVDKSPPTINGAIDMSSAFLSPEQLIEFSWIRAFFDAQSDIEYYIWCVGSLPNLCDQIGTSKTTSASYVLTYRNTFVDGKHYFMNIQAVNGAGLIAHMSSSSFTSDGSYPDSGHVYEIDGSNSIKDIDFQVQRSELHISWDAFFDPHLKIRSYSISIGTCIGCSDLLDEIAMGLQTSLHLPHARLRNNIKYFATVTGCSIANLCTRSSSDGVLIDSNPPRIGQILDGHSVADVDYQSSRQMVFATIENMYDRGSGLHSMIVWCSILSSNSQHINITEAFEFHPHHKIVLALTTPLPENQRIFTNVFICDNVGLCAHKMSNGFIVDSSPPIEHNQVSVNNIGGSIIHNSQVWTTSLIVSWNITDRESPISFSTLSITTDNGVSGVNSDIILQGEHSKYTFTNTCVTDGDFVIISVRTCNLASLCTLSQSEPILIDSSPPLVGKFSTSITNINSALHIPRNVSDVMAYSQMVQEERLPIFNETTNDTIYEISVNFQPARIHLAWIGFEDPHSDILKYFVTIGRSYRGTELMLGGATTLKHNRSDYRTEGYLQKASIDILGNISHAHDLFISISAVNKVGLRSKLLHGVFESVPNVDGTGILNLKRHCDINSCEGHCACAPHGQTLCTLLPSSSCTNDFDIDSLARIDVLDVNPANMFYDNATDIDFTVSTDTIAAQWRIDTIGRVPIWFEWSVGLFGERPGAGLLDPQKQSIWFDSLNQTHALFSISSSHIEDLILEGHRTYVFYVKAWYSASEYRIVSTNGVRIDTTAPNVNRAAKVMETVTQESNADVDYVTNISSIFIKWTDSFRGLESGIMFYKVCIGTEAGLCDVKSQYIDDTTTSGIALSGLVLEQHVLYRSSITACNAVDMCSVIYSDGFRVDLRAPVTGIVFDGPSVFDETFTHDVHSLSASWTGFYDDESVIVSYTVCFSFDPTAESVFACHQTRSKSITVTLETPLEHDVYVFALVSATNGAGLESDKVYSDGVLVDLTAPQSYSRHEINNNLLFNPSFESDTLSPWSSSNNRLEIKHDLPHEGRQLICMTNNTISQRVRTTRNINYRVSFATKRHFRGDTSQPAATCFVVVGLTSELFVLTDKSNINDSFHSEWVFHHVYFHALNDETTLTLGTEETDMSICFDNIILREISETRSDDETGIIHVVAKASTENTELFVSWNTADFESSIVETLIAFGTVQGGVQLSNFKSVGHGRTYRKNGLKLKHGTTIHTTLKVTNGAGLYSIIYAEPITIDLTPPIIDRFEVNNGVQFLTTLAISVTWEATDSESDIETCWVSGSTDRSITALYTAEIEREGVLQLDLNPDLSHGEKIQFLLRCKNKNGLVASSLSNEIVMVLGAPSVAQASINVIQESCTIYPSRGNYVSNIHDVWLRWDGIVSDVAIDYHCQINLSNVTNRPLPWINVGFQHRRFLHITDLSLETGQTYSLELKCVNDAGYISETIATTFIVDTTYPYLTVTSPRYEWSNSTTLSVIWTDSFASASQLTYQLHAGTVRGGTDIFRWHETSETWIEITGLDRSITYYISIVAINMAGLFTTHPMIIL